MYRIIADYHTHTINSHGKGTIRQNVEAALNKGLKTIAISDHGPGHWTYGIKKGYLQRMRAEIDEMKKEYPEVEILLGVEANLIGCNGEIDVDQNDLQYIDMLLLGFHHGAMPKNLSAAMQLYLRNYVARVLPFLREGAKNKNTDAMIAAIRNHKVDIVTHPGAKIEIDSRRLAKAAVERGTALEINSSHGYLTVECARIANEEGVNFVIDSDAHVPENVGEFADGIRIAEAAGISASKIINAVEE